MSDENKLTNCDICDTEQGTHVAIVYGIETVLCDKCGGINND